MNSHDRDPAGPPRSWLSRPVDGMHTPGQVLGNSGFRSMPSGRGGAVAKSGGQTEGKRGAAHPPCWLLPCQATRLDAGPGFASSPQLGCLQQATHLTCKHLTPEGIQRTAARCSRGTPRCRLRPGPSREPSARVTPGPCQRRPGGHTLSFCASLYPGLGRSVLV